MCIYIYIYTCRGPSLGARVPAVVGVGEVHHGDADQGGHRLQGTIVNIICIITDICYIIILNIITTIWCIIIIVIISISSIIIIIISSSSSSIPACRYSTVVYRVPFTSLPISMLGSIFTDLAMTWIG